MGNSNAKKAAKPQAKTDRAAVLEKVGMKRWMRLTARKHSAGKPTSTPTADAAAAAIAQMLGKPRANGSQPTCS